MWAMIVSVPDHCLSFYLTLICVSSRPHCLQGILLKASVLECFLPGLCSTSNWYDDNASIHQAI